MDARIATAHDMDVVYVLTHDVYVKHGYCLPQPNGRLRHYPHLDGIPETTVFIIIQDGVVIGTNSLTLDGPAKLHVDQDFPSATAIFRKKAQSTQRQLAASWRIITDPQCRTSLMVIKSLIDITLIEAYKQSVDDMLFSFNPKHERIYKKLLGLETIARGICNATNSAPSVLMYGSCLQMLARWQKIRN